MLATMVWRVTCTRSFLSRRVQADSCGRSNVRGSLWFAIGQWVICGLPPSHGDTVTRRRHAMAFETPATLFLSLDSTETVHVIGTNFLQASGSTPS